MSGTKRYADSLTKELIESFESVRQELDVPVSFQPHIAQSAADSIALGPRLAEGRKLQAQDHTQLPLITIDPPTSTDLDQAFYATRTEGGYRVFYAIADLAVYVQPRDLVDVEARKRGVTLYSPDHRASLHPECINEQASSLLANQTRHAMLWQIDLDEQANQLNAHLGRALVSSKAKLSYRECQTAIDDPSAASKQSLDHRETLLLLEEIGEKRIALEIERGAISLQLPSQEIERHNGQYRLIYDATLPIERWNAQISLLAGMAAAEIMVDAGCGLLRTLPPLDPATVNDVRNLANALDISWPQQISYPDRMRSLDPSNGRQAALLSRAARSFRGAGYEAFTNAELPENQLHGAVAARYSHVTAPLRRLCDRFSNEIVVAACAGQEPPQWALEALEDLPALMNKARNKDSSLDRAMIDLLETFTLRDRIGESFEAIVLSHTRYGAKILLRDPAIVAFVKTQPELGTKIAIKLTSVDVKKRRVNFKPI